MAEGNGEISLEEVSGKDSDVGRTPDYPKLIEYGLDPKVRILMIINTCQAKHTYIAQYLKFIF